jgi:hypothetical protein
MKVMGQCWLSNGEIFDVERTVRLDEGGEKPQHAPVAAHDDDVGDHVVVELVAGTGSTAGVVFRSDLL